MKSKRLTSLLKCCKNCKKTFEITIEEVKGSGSTGAFRRIFCNDKCKNEFNRKKSDGKVDRFCIVCNKKFLSYPSHKRSYCSRKCKNDNNIDRTKVERIDVSCPNCKEFFKKIKTSQYPKYCSRKCFKESGTEIKNCITCSKPYEVKKSKNFILRCSRLCQFFDQSNGKIKIHLNGRTGYRIDLGKEYYFKSSLEADYARFLLYFGIKFNYESKTFITKTGAYTPDFFLPDFNLFVEMKGVTDNGKPYEKMMTKNILKQKSVTDSDFKIITITQKEFIDGLKAASLWREIPNLEQRNYKKTKELIIKHEN